MGIPTLLMIVAFIALVLASTNLVIVQKVNLGWLGMALWLLALLIKQGTL